jgi:hypothetical protein
MPRREERETSDRSARPLEGLPVIRASVTGIDWEASGIGCVHQRRERSIQ